MEIPTKTVKLSNDKEVKLRAWTTQSQDDEYQSLMFGDEELNLMKDDEQELKTNFNRYNEAVKFLIKSLLVDISYEEYDALPPKDRAVIQAEAISIKKGV